LSERDRERENEHKQGKKQAEGPPHKGMKKTPNLRGELVGWGNHSKLAKFLIVGFMEEVEFKLGLG